MKELLINLIEQSKSICILLFLNFCTLQSQNFKSHYSDIFLSFDWRNGFFHLYDNTIYPFTWIGTYDNVNDTIFCNPCLSVIDTSAIKYKHKIGGDSIRKIVFIKDGDMLKSITAKWNGYNYQYELFDSLYVIDDYNKMIWLDSYK